MPNILYVLFLNFIKYCNEGNISSIFIKKEMHIQRLSDLLKVTAN